MNGQPRTPILVTGLHRSGTTWVGRMLAASNAVRYLHEPMNPTDGPRVMRGAIRHAYHYICPENDGDFEPAIRRMFSMRQRVWARIKAPRPAADLRRLVAGGTPVWWKSLHLRRHLVKDPFALFSAPWFAERMGCRVVVVVRRPEGVIGSLKRMGWTFDHRHLLEQPLLMRDHLEPFRSDLERVAAAPNDVIAQGSLLWRIANQVVESYRRDCPQFHFVTHEELSLNPVAGFARLYDSLQLPFTGDVEQRIIAHCGNHNATEVQQREPGYGLAGYVTVNSQANLHQWKRRLTPDEVSRVRRLTACESEPPGLDAADHPQAA